MVGIYKIENLINYKVYIGLSNNIEHRWNKHKSIAFNPKDKGYNYPIYRAIRKYGLENFSFEILEECKVSELSKKEKEYISKFDSFFNGYNQTMGGEGSIGSIQKETVIGIINDLENTNSFHREIADKWKVSIETVQGINTGRYWRHDRNYPIQTPKKIEKHYYCKECGKEIKTNSNYCVECAHLLQRKVDRPSREELKCLIRTVPFTKIAKQFNVTDNAIRRWCDSYCLPRRIKDINSYSDKEWELI